MKIITLSISLLIATLSYSQNEFVGTWVLDSINLKWRKEKWPLGVITSIIEIDTNKNIIEKTYYEADAICFRSDDEENPRLLNECMEIWEGEVRAKNSKKVIFTNWILIKNCDPTGAFKARFRRPYFYEKKGNVLILTYRKSGEKKYFHLKT